MHGWEAHSGSHSPYSKDWRRTGGGALLRLGAHPSGAMLWFKQTEGLAPLAMTDRERGVVVSEPRWHTREGARKKAA